MIFPFHVNFPVAPQSVNALKPGKDLAMIGTIASYSGLIEQCDVSLQYPQLPTCCHRAIVVSGLHGLDISIRL